MFHCWNFDTSVFGVLVTNTECCSDSGGLFIAQGVSLFRASKTFCCSSFLANGIQSNVEKCPWKTKRSLMLNIVVNTFIRRKNLKHQMQFYKCNPIYNYMRGSLEKSWLWSNFSWGRFVQYLRRRFTCVQQLTSSWYEGLRSAATSGKDKTSSDKEDDRMIQRCNKFCVRHTKDKSVEF